jgi:hypothetical protein
MSIITLTKHDTDPSLGDVPKGGTGAPETCLKPWDESSLPPAGKVPILLFEDRETNPANGKNR